MIDCCRRPALESENALVYPSGPFSRVFGIVMHTLEPTSGVDLTTLRSCCVYPVNFLLKKRILR